MKHYDETSLGGRNRAFESTHWSVILQARTLDDRHRQAVVGELLRRYWKPVYCYLRRKGHGNEAAKDLTQSFFGQIVLGRGLFQQANPAKGRFRTFLLTALDRFTVSTHRAETARRRAPAGPVVELDGVEGLDVPDPDSGASPDAAFDRVWAAELLGRALAETERELSQSGKALHWKVFEVRVVRPILDDAEPPALPSLCEELGIEDEPTASNLLVTAKRRFRAVLRRLIGDSVASEAEVDEEISDLIAALSKRPAGP